MTDQAEFTLKLINKLSAPARQARRSLGELDDGLRRTERAGSRFGALDVFKGNVLTAAAGKMLHLAESAGALAGELVTFGQNSRMAFGQLAKHGAVPEKLFEHSRALAKRFGLDVIDTTDQYKKFLALQFNPKEAGKMIKMGADLRALGADAEAVKGAFTAIGQIKSKGKLQAEEMLQLAERGISGQLIWEEIGKLMGGKSTDQVRKLQQQGKVTAEIGLKAIENAVNRKLQQNKLGESGAKFADTTISGMLGRIKALGQDAGITLVDKLTGPLTRMAGASLGKLEGFLTSPEGASMIDRIANGLGRAADFAGTLASAFGESFGDTWKRLGEGSQMLGDAFGGGKGLDFAQTLLSIARALGEASALTVGFGIALGRVAMDTAILATVLWEAGKGALDGLIRPLGEAAGAISSWWDGMVAAWNDRSSTMFERMNMIGRDIVTGLARGIWGAISLPIEAITGVIGGAIAGARNVLDSHSPSRVFEELGLQSVAGFAMGLDAGAPLATSAALQWGPEVSSLGFAGPGAGDTTTVGGSTFAPAITVHVGSTGDSDSRDIATDIAGEVERIVEGLFRRMAMETG